MGGVGVEATFDGEGAVTYDGAAFGFVARDVHRNFIGDCYPDRGTITIRAARSPLPAAELSIRFQRDEVTGLDSDNSGEVYVDWQGPPCDARSAAAPAPASDSLRDNPPAP